MRDEQVVRKTRPFDPDELDRQIIRLLRADGRRSNREIARTLDVPEATVRYRVRRLIESNILRITASVDPEHLGYGLTAVISVQVEPSRVNAVAEEISAMPEVMWVAITAGAHDIMLMGSFRNQDEMFTFLTDRLARIEGTYRTETSVALRIMKKQHEWASDLTTRVETGLPVEVESLV
jgi:Lrp/AsnC family transcriptional regulator, regulator for asnA, asnC and gidA